jgi:hypothetical protein
MILPGRVVGGDRMVRYRRARKKSVVRGVNVVDRAWKLSGEDSGFENAMEPETTP